MCMRRRRTDEVVVGLEVLRESVDDQDDEIAPVVQEEARGQVGDLCAQGCLSKGKLAQSGAWPQSKASIPPSL
jgi:hypothetical protein